MKTGLYHKVVDITASIVYIVIGIGWTDGAANK
jgi:hypothetical protein